MCWFLPSLQRVSVVWLMAPSFLGKLLEPRVDRIISKEASGVGNPSPPCFLFLSRFCLGLPPHPWLPQSYRHHLSQNL